MSLPHARMNACVYGAHVCLGCCDRVIRKEGRSRTRNPNHKKKTIRNHRI